MRAIWQAALAAQLKSPSIEKRNRSPIQSGRASDLHQSYRPQIIQVIRRIHM
jgi:hypothetical protein